jgi:hypothetical protein
MFKFLKYFGVFLKIELNKIFINQKFNQFFKIEK